MIDFKGILEVGSRFVSGKGIIVLILIIMLFVIVVYLAKFEIEQNSSAAKSIGTTVVRSVSASMKSSADRDQSTGGQAILNVEHVQLSPRRFPTLPSYLYFEIGNSGSALAEKPNVTIDLGEGSFEKIEIEPNNACNLPSLGTNQSVAQFTCGDIEPDTNLYFYAEITDPDFKSIIVNSSSLAVPIEFSYDSYDRQRDSWGWFKTFLQIVLACVIVILTIYFLIAFIDLVNKKLKVIE